MYLVLLINGEDKGLLVCICSREGRLLIFVFIIEVIGRFRFVIKLKFRDSD